MKIVQLDEATIKKSIIAVYQYQLFKIVAIIFQFFDTSFIFTVIILI